MSEQTTYVTLKWGSLKSWNFATKRGRQLMQQYVDLGMSMSAMHQHDTLEQKELICQMIDECDGDTICLEWDGEYVTKEKAKEYVREYGTKKAAA